MKRRTKIGIGAGLILLVGSLGALSVTAGNRGATAVRIETVTRRDLVATVTGTGWVRPRRAVDVQSDIMGRIIELLVEEGDTVKQGQVLLRIDPTQYEALAAQARAAVSGAQAGVAEARASWLLAKSAAERARAIYERDSTLVSPQALEEAETQLTVRTELLAAANHNLDRARAGLREAEDRLAKTTIRAPIDGVVTRVEVEEGETAIVGMMNNPGSLLLTISDLSVMEAVVQVDETDVPELELGDSVTLEIDAFPRRTFTGRVTEIGHSAIISAETRLAAGAAGQNQSVDFEVVVTIDDPPPELRPDLSATADIVTATRTGALSIPIIALTVREKGKVEPLPAEEPAARSAAERAASSRRMDEEGVFVVRGGKAVFTPVTVGIAGGEYFEVLEGLAEGDSIVAGPFEAIRSLENNKPVRAIKQESAEKKR